VIAAIECAGAPRDLGLDQGRACHAQLRAAYVRAPLRERLPLPLSAEGARLVLDLKRHFPHLAESLAGLAVGAGVPERWLFRRLVREPLEGPQAARAVARAEGALPLLAVACAGPWIARRSRPEGSFACVELARPWRVAAFAGVNEAGLAVVSAPASAPAVACAAPAALLAQDCLQRFAKVENALDWCSGRPAGQGAGLLFADARGELAGIEIRAGERRVLRPEGALLAWADGNDARAELAKALREAGPATPGALARLLAAPAHAAAAAAIVDPRARRLAVIDAATANAEPDWLAI
jgi:hypothetical protein